MTACMTCPHPNTDHALADPAECLAAGCRCEHWTQPTLSYLIQEDDDVICVECDRAIPAGSPYAEQLEDMAGADIVVNVVCVYCCPLSVAS